MHEHVAHQKGCKEEGKLQGTHQIVSLALLGAAH
jgi:hypothetical protein